MIGCWTAFDSKSLFQWIHRIEHYLGGTYHVYGKLCDLCGDGAIKDARQPRGKFDQLVTITVAMRLKKIDAED